MLASSASRYTEPVSAWFRVLVGLLAIPAAIAAGLVAWVALAASGREAPERGSAIVILGVICGAVSLMLLVWAFRLLSGKARAADQGLLSPVGLRVGAVYFGLSPVLLFVVREDLSFLAGAPVGIGIAIACWHLASLRGRSAVTTDGGEE